MQSVFRLIVSSAAATVIFAGAGTSVRSQSAAPPPQSQQVPAPSQDAAARESHDSLAIVARIEQLVNRNADYDGEHLKAAGKVTMDRADLDEILALTRELKVMLQK